MKMDKGTLIRTIVLFIALLNQILVSCGLYKIPGTAEQQTEVLSTLFTLVTSIIAWFKNNYVTAKGKRQKEVLKQQNLTK
ncbi:phage holin [Heyndrickxia coagulans]|uniref:phage holin n=2 Tax=Heyndrickxia coagulans TaxID=1398 RepID=UPI000491D1C5|nr:phage holin [Heyndrickxia coagulans]MDR4225621.1 phage holin [Heyndrickxia coagulans DSM 1 = ATCC 7050]MED4495624.1 phage holin [Heyndrickxia coagulans]MED4536949.1 phage holin [Heyndrickxia coagulans]QJE33856.1 phage holin [Heyndrickxia coagulans]QQS93786.1 phage holin [Heyndrickxia coagulans]